MEGVVEKLLNPSVFLGLFVGVFVSIMCYYILSSKPEKVIKKASSKTSVIFVYVLISKNHRILNLNFQRFNSGLTCFQEISCFRITVVNTCS